MFSRKLRLQDFLGFTLNSQAAGVRGWWLAHVDTI